jgi:porphobilinogen synthase
MSFPEHRPRRLRRTPAFRALVREQHLRVEDLIAPLFVKEGIAEPVAISSMPGQHQHTVESLRKEVAELRELGVLAFMLFGVPANKDLSLSTVMPEVVLLIEVSSLKRSVGLRLLTIPIRSSFS